MRGEVGDEVGKAYWGQIVKVFNIRFQKICSELQEPAPQYGMGKSNYIICFGKSGPGKMIQMIWRKNSEGKEPNEQQAAVRGVDLIQHGGVGIECRLVST